MEVTNTSSLLISHHFIKKQPKDAISDETGIPRKYDLDLYKIIYKTSDLKGNMVTASGLVAIPHGFQDKALSSIVYCHGTVLRKFNVPSRLAKESNNPQVMASAGYIGIAPDYLGLGDSPGLHPYLHAETEATTTVNMIRATREFLKEINQPYTNNTYISGFSEGGHVGMATLKYAQENNLINELGLKAGGLINGSYNLTELQMEPLVFYNFPYEFLGYGIYFILTYQNAYGGIFEDFAEIGQPQFIEKVKKWYDGEQDEYSMREVNRELPNLLTEIMNPEYLEKLEKDPEHPLWKAVARNNNYDWTPEMPLRFYFCDADEQVAYFNSTTTEAHMNERGAKDVKSVKVMKDAGHVQCLDPALKAAFEYFEELEGSL